PDRKPRSVTTALAVVIACLCFVALGLAPVLAQIPAGCPAPKPEPLQTPLNLTLVKHQLVYYRCTRYDAELAKVLHEAAAWVKQRAHRVARPALVLDIDETSLSNWEQILHNDFGFIAEGDCDLNSKRACGQGDWERSARAVAIEPTLDLFNAAKAHHVAVFF